MARFAYDVNTRTRLIDVHKQFNGGLKTVDTDDALGSVYLRQAENVSLSEFGFIEKRYGTIEKDSIKQTNGKLQGFWEFEGFSIYAINNKFYHRNSTGTEVAVNALTQESSDYRYPTLPTYDSSGFDSTVYRDMNAVNINSVLYIFTGHYPVYVKIDSNTNLPVFYWFSVDIPTYDEIVVTGHNLLEDDYTNLYHTQSFPFTGSFTTYNSGIDYPKIIESATSPRFPAVTENDLKFYFRTQYPTDMDSWITTSNQNFFEIKLDSVQFRDSSPGAGEATFTEIDPESIEFEPKNNYSGSGTFASRGEELIQNGSVTKTKYSRTAPNGSQYNYNFQVYLDFEIERNAFTSRDKFLLELFQFDGVQQNPIYLQDYHSFYSTTYTSGIPAKTKTRLFADLKITPVDYNGNILKKDAITLNLRDNSNEYTFSPPEALNKGTDIAKYVFELKLVEMALVAQSSSTLQESLNDLQTNPENYTFTLSDIDTKGAPGSGNLITSNNVPTLSFTVSDLISGTFDFKVRFVREEWSPATLNGSFERVNLVQKEFFETIVSEVTIIAERFQDLPGTEGILPKLKPIWTCNKVMEHYGKLMVWGSTEMPTAVFYSFPDRPTYFPSKFYLDFTNGNSQPIEAVTPYMNILVAQTASQTWGIRGNSGLIDAPAPYVTFGINGTVGTIAYKSVRPVRNHLFFLSRQGIIALKSLYAADEQYNIEFVDRNIRNIVPQDSDAVGIQFDNQYWLNFPNNSITLRWYIDKKAWVKDVYQGYATSGFKGVFKYQIVNGKLEFITHPSETADVNNLTIYKVGVDYEIPTDLFQPISAKFETAFLNQNYPFHPKNYKEAKLDFTLQNEYNLGRDAIYDSTRDSDFTTSGGGGSSAFLVTLPVAFSRHHRYRVEFTPESGSTVTHIPLTSVSIEGQSSYSSDLTAIGDASNTLIWEFNITGDYNQNAVATDFVATLSTTDANAIESIVIRDVTYDTNLAFSTYVISEDKTLNFNNYSGYDQATVDVDLDLTLTGQLGDWVFGTSDFGKKVTAVKTIKLAGKGYNAKVYVEDTSRSKWTLESMGLTYKMKRARSR